MLTEFILRRLWNNLDHILFISEVYFQDVLFVCRGIRHHSPHLLAQQPAFVGTEPRIC
jgi:hypothetical protein